MIIVKKRLVAVIPCLVLLALFATVQFKNLKEYYEEILNSSGLIVEDFEKELKEENLRAMEDEKEYQKILSEEQGRKEEAGEEEKGGYISANDLRLSARSALLLDASNNRVLFEKDGYKEMPMASTTKIMTCIVTLENSKLDEVVTVSSHASTMPDVQLNIKPGEQYYLLDLLYSLMLESHNDSAVAIAEHVGGSVEGFATMMNDKARELGCENTNFVTPNGLDAAGHYTTARDLAVIASYAIQNEQFISITNTSSYNFKELKKGRSYSITNKNRFLYMMEGAIGVKTGFTNGAGYCFVGAIKKSDRTLVSVVLGSGWPPRKQLKWMDTKELMNYGIKNYEPRQIFENVNLKPLVVRDGQQRYEALDLKGEITLLMRKDEKVKVVYEIPRVLQAPIKEKSIVGYARYYIDDIYYAEIPIYTKEDIAKIDYKFCIKKLLALWSMQY